MIYFDNAATTYPKPYSVAAAVSSAVTVLGGNPGRSGHAMSVRAAEQVFKVRSLCAKMFGAEPENVIFTQNCTHALNLAIKGIMSEPGHIIISSMEHNSVSRPVFALKKRGVSFSVAEVSESDEQTVENFARLITPETRCVACTIASNVTGRILPYKQIAQLCRKHGICFIADGAQACGVIPLSMADGFNFLCTAGHKGLYGPTGTGLLISDGKYKLQSIIEGGTGTTSDELFQPDFLPERLESGTLNTVGIMGLGEGIKHVMRLGEQRIYKKETMLCELFIKRLENNPMIVIYRQKGCLYVPIVSFNCKGMPSSQLSQKLNDAGFALRGGLQCAALAHRQLQTSDGGTVRFSPSVFNSEREVIAICNAINRICANIKTVG